MKQVLQILDAHRADLMTNAEALVNATPSGVETIATKLRAAAALLLADIGAIFDGLSEDAKEAINFVELEIGMGVAEDAAAAEAGKIAAGSQPQPGANIHGLGPDVANGPSETNVAQAASSTTVEAAPAIAAVETAADVKTDPVQGQTTAVDPAKQ